MRALLFTLLVTSTFSINAQAIDVVKDKSFSYLELYLDLQVRKKPVEYVNCKFTSSATSEEQLLFDYFEEQGNSHFPVSKVGVSWIKFENCTFNKDQNHPFTFVNINFIQGLEFNNCQGYGLAFENCIAYRSLTFIDPNFNYVTFSGCNFFEVATFNDSKIEQLDFSGCTFIANQFSETFGFDFQNRNHFLTFLMKNTEFIDASGESSSYKFKDSIIHESGMLKLTNFDTDYFISTDNYFDCSVVFGEFGVHSNFKFENRLLREIIFDAVPSLPTESASLPYSSIDNRIGIAISLANGEHRFIQYNQKKDFTADIENPWEVKDPESRIIPVYSRLLAIYNANNDLKSYNNCFSQLKLIEQTAAEVRYDNDPKFDHQFRWRMDQFLQYFSDYGTDPVLSLKNGMFAILLFAILYMIFPSEQDNLSLTRIKAAFQRYISHFGKGEKQFYTPDEIYLTEIKEITELKKDIATYRSHLPPVIRFFSLPISYLVETAALVKHKVRQLLYFNIYQNWQQLNKKRQFKATAILTVTLVIFASWGLFMRVLNALALSLNAFVTLGYGEMEAKGIARYFCVLEGIIGWFLLSVFSVSLISQILQ